MSCVQTVRGTWTMILSGLFGNDPERAERELVRRAREGEARAFKEIFDRCAPAVRRFCRDLLRDAPAADEATQETFVRAFDKVAALRQEDRLLAWLLGIARRVCFEHHRRSRREAERHDDSEAAALGCAAPFTPETAALDREAADVVHRGMRALSADRQAALLLRFDHGLGYAEIATAMGWSVAKAKVEVHRARLLLRDRLVRYEEGEGP